METENPININISRSNDTKDKYNEFKEYLVINNFDLQKQVLEMKQEINDLKTQLNEKENDEDKYDSRTRYMRSLLTNLNELKKGYKEISENRKYLVSEVDKLWNNMYKNSLDYNIKITIYFIVLLLINKFSMLITIFNNYYFEATINSTINIILLYTIFKTYLEYYKLVKSSKKNIINKQHELNTINIKKEKELTILDESTLSLENWIYEV